MLKISIVCFILIVSGSCCIAQQVPDTLYTPPVFIPAYQGNKGPVVYIDEAHHNFHTASGRYLPFALLLRKDGYTVKENTKVFTADYLKTIKTLVIANALHERNLQEWRLPTPSAFTKQEIAALKQWVYNGGSLFLIADHMPFAGASAELAQVFGFKFYNCFAMDTIAKKSSDQFTRKEGTLSANEITSGKTNSVDSIATFTGQAFDIPDSAVSIITLGNNFTIIECEQAWQFQTNAKKFSGKGKSQGACLKFGKGRVLVFGEAAMFTAQIAGNTKAGMNTSAGRYNYQLLLNSIHWLDQQHE